MDDVADLLMKMPSCNMVNLSWNRSYGVASSLKKMLVGAITRIFRLPHIEFLDITYNPFASIDRTEFFQNPALCDDTKLVWVPSVFLEEKNQGTPTWHYIITNMDRQKILLKTHRKYDKTEWK
jgi:hypothetical protein